MFFVNIKPTDLMTINHRIVIVFPTDSKLPKRQIIDPLPGYRTTSLRIFENQRAIVLNYSLVEPMVELAQNQGFYVNKK